VYFVYGPYAYRDKKVVSVFVRFSCAASLVYRASLWVGHIA
jgi:hypothetical protein